MDKPGFLSDGCHFVPFIFTQVDPSREDITKTVIQNAVDQLNENAMQRKLDQRYSQSLLLEKLLLPITLNITSKRLIVNVQES